MVRKVSLGVLQRFKRFFVTENRSTQTSDRVVEDLKDEIAAKDATLQKSRTKVREKEREIEHEKR